MGGCGEEWSDRSVAGLTGPGFKAVLGLRGGGGLNGRALSSAGSGLPVGVTVDSR